MRRLKDASWVRRCIVVFICLPALQGRGQTVAPLSLQENGWTIDCSVENASLSISAKNLGNVARDIQLNEETSSGLHRLTHFSAHINGDRQLIIETTAPQMTWVLHALPGKVTIATSDFHGVLTGWAASSIDRTIAVLLDPQGEPVQWEGTYEALTTYGGSLTSNPSYLPRRNPEVMHMGLGHVSGAGMHSLFDRGTDTAIDFGQDAGLQTSAGKEDAYALTIPGPQLCRNPTYAGLFYQGAASSFLCPLRRYVFPIRADGLVELAKLLRGCHRTRHCAQHRLALDQVEALWV